MTKISRIPKELNKYNFIFDNHETLIRLFYWKQPEKKVGDTCLFRNNCWIEDNRSDFIERLKRESREGYITNSVFSPEKSVYSHETKGPNAYGGTFYDMYHFDFNKKKIPNRLILALYLGHPLSEWKEGEPLEPEHEKLIISPRFPKKRMIIYQHNKVDLKKALRLLEWQKELKKKFDRHSGYYDSKLFIGPVSSSAVEELRKKKPYSNLEDLMK